MAIADASNTRSCRLFIGLWPTEGVVETCERDSAPLRSIATLTLARQPHITLAFLGEVGVDSLDALRQAIVQATERSHPITLRLEGRGAFPTRKSPRVLWFGVGGDVVALQALANSIRSETLAIAPRQDLKPFHPHITAARLRGQADHRQIEAWCDARQTSVEWLADEVALVRSIPGRGYETIGRFHLGW